MSKKKKKKKFKKFLPRAASPAGGRQAGKIKAKISQQLQQLEKQSQVLKSVATQPSQKTTQQKKSPQIIQTTEKSKSNIDTFSDLKKVAWVSSITFGLLIVAATVNTQTDWILKVSNSIFEILQIK